MFYCLNIFDFLKAGPQKQFSFKPVRCAKKVADHCYIGPNVRSLNWLKKHMKKPNLFVSKRCLILKFQKILWLQIYKQKKKITKINAKLVDEVPVDVPVFIDYHPLFQLQTHQTQKVHFSFDNSDRWPSGKSVCLWSCKLGFDFKSSQTYDFQIGIHSFPA